MDLQERSYHEQFMRQALDMVKSIHDAPFSESPD